MSHVAYKVCVYLFCVGLIASCSSDVERSGVFPDIEGLERYLAAGGDPNAIGHKDRKSRSMRTLLHNTADSGDAKMVSVLVRTGANPNAVDVGGWTPLMGLFTTRDEVEGRKEILEVLLPVTDLSILDVYGENALQLARKYGTEAEISLLERAMLRTTPGLNDKPPSSETDEGRR